MKSLNVVSEYDIYLCMRVHVNAHIQGGRDFCSGVPEIAVSGFPPSGYASGTKSFYSVSVPVVFRRRLPSYPQERGLLRLRGAPSWQGVRMTLAARSRCRSARPRSALLLDAAQTTVLEEPREPGPRCGVGGEGRGLPVSEGTSGVGLVVIVSGGVASALRQESSRGAGKGPTHAPSRWCRLLVRLERSISLPHRRGRHRPCRVTWDTGLYHANMGVLQ